MSIEGAVTCILLWELRHRTVVDLPRGAILMGTLHFPCGVPPSSCIILTIVGRHATSSELSENGHSLEETLWVTIFLYVVWHIDTLPFDYMDSSQSGL